MRNESNCGNINTAPILKAAQRWRDRALLKNGSVFSEKHLWTSEGLGALNQYFAQNLDAGAGNFIEKLHVQLAPTDARVKQLAAEMNWLLLLCPDKILATSKRKTVNVIWRWSKEPMPDTAQEMLADEILRGLGAAARPTITIGGRSWLSASI